MNFIKKIDRTLHSGDYQQLKNNLLASRSQERTLKDELNELQKKYQANKLSPQAAALEAEIQNKQAALQRAGDQLNVYQELGRHGLGVDPEAYKLSKAEQQGFKTGSAAGTVVGGLGGLALGHTLFSESVVERIKKLIQETEEKWAQEVTKKEKFHPPEGTFKEKNAPDIAKIISQNWTASYQTTMSRLNFFLNRGGENIPNDIKSKVENAKEIVRKHYNKDKK